MTAEERRRIREAIDAHQRARRDIFISDDEVIVCRGCGCDSDDRTAGCRTCTNRHLRRKWRGDPDYRAEDNWRRCQRRRLRLEAT
jgi:hypothetical protein